MPTHRPSFVSGAALLLGLLVFHASAHADGGGRLTAMEENDSIFFNSDRDYTQGIRLSYLSGGNDWNAPYRWLADILPVFKPDATGQTRKTAWTFGQSIFTPRDTDRINPDPSDRPYAGWLYAGASFMQQSDLAKNAGHQLENFEVLLGVVGPASLGRQVQNDWHQIIGVATAKGWGYQLQNEPALVLSYERKWRFERPLAGGMTFDVIPEVGASVGNALTYADAGVMLRLGRNSEIDYGPARVRPALSGTDWYDADAIGARTFGWYVFAGVQGRLVARNVFLDGSSFADSRSVDKKPAVADFMGGVSLFWSHTVKFDLAVTQRTREFYGQLTQDRFVTASLSFGL